jgi:hypothetical protein
VVDPPHQERNVPLSTSELQFELIDHDDDTLSYSVITLPNIGSDIVTGVKSGIHSFPIDGLEYDRQYYWTVRVTDGRGFYKKTFTFRTEDGPPFDPFDEGWHFRKEIMINESMVHGELKNFPMLVSVVDPDLREHAQVDGDDILFMADTGVAQKLNHEVEYYNSNVGELVAWVNLPLVSYDSSTSLYMYYGNNYCGPQEYPLNVWNASYKVVHHMDDDPDTTHIRDSSCQHHDGTKKASNQPLESGGFIRKAQYFDGDDDFIDSEDFAIPVDFSVSMWVKPDEIDDNNYCFIGHHWGSGWDLFKFGMNTDGYYAGTNMESYSAGERTSGWQYLTCTGVLVGNPRTNITVYRNASRLWWNRLPGRVDTGPNTFEVTIGRDWDYGPVSNDYFKGMIDEVRVMQTVRNSEWFATEYDNQNNPSDFLVFGPEEPGP